MRFQQILKVVAVSTPIVLLAATFAFLPPAKPNLMDCGHPYPSWRDFHWVPGVAKGSHCCLAGGMVNTLRMMGGAQEMYRLENGVFATRFEQLTNSLIGVREFEFQFRSNGTNWSISVPPQGQFPGYYLFTNAHLYFNHTKPATTADLDLWAKRP
jgi:hypothetical protein